jgi:steroid delta-isomerase-like uncharacterized protein
MVGCQDKAAMAELEEFKAQAVVEEQNKELISNFFEELDKGNAEIVKEIFASDVKSYWPSGSTVPTSQEELFEMTKMFLNAFADLNHTIEEIIAKGDKVIIRFIVRGTHQAELQGIPPTGNKIEFSVISVLRFENGKVVEQWQESDALGMMQQLGMELKPKEEEK